MNDNDVLSVPVSSFMQTPVYDIRPNSTLRAAAKILRDQDVGALAVMRGASIVGLLSERDVVRALANGADPDEVWVGDVMSDLPRYLVPEENSRTAAQVMLAAGIRHLPVVEDGALVGIVSIRDLLGHLDERSHHAEAGPDN